MLLKLVKSFLQIGAVSFGGYMSMVMHVRRKLVDEEKLVTEEDFSKGLALASILPGPVAVNVSVYCGYLLAGIAGAAISLISVLAPSFIMMVALFYSLDAATKLVQLDTLIFMVAGVAFGLILAAGVQQTRKYCTDNVSVGVFLVSFLLLFFFNGYLTILALLVVWSITAQFVVKAPQNTESLVASRETGKVGLPLVLVLVLIASGFLTSTFFLAEVFFQFSKISLTTFGGAYVVVPLMKNVLVDQLSWISSDDLLLGISLGQLTPGPLLISAAFFGQKLGGLPGAFMATAGMFVPTGMVMIISAQYLSQIQHSVFISRAMKLIHPFVAGLIVYAAVNILVTSYADVSKAWYFIWWVACFFLIYFFSVKPIWLIGLSLASGLVFLML